MKILIVEDDFSSRFLLQKMLADYGTCYIAINGSEAVDAVKNAWDAAESFDLICMDILMPEMDGQDALRQIRRIEEERGILSSEGAKIIMVTALSNMKNVKDAFQGLCDGYLTKPISKNQLLESLKALELFW